MSWRINSVIYASEIMRLMKKSYYPRDGCACVRESILIRLLTYSSDNAVFFDIEEFCKRTNSPEKQARLVWDICLREGVLSEVGSGYSARQWLIDTELLVETEAREKRRKKSPIRDETVSMDENTNEAGKSQTGASTCEKTAYTPNVETEAQKNELNPSKTKIAIRPNVFLSCSEIDELRKEFSDEQITKMIDKLSEYKTQTNRYYASDFQAIKRWVVRWVQEHPVSTSKIESPDWLTGV